MLIGGLDDDRPNARDGDGGNNVLNGGQAEALAWPKGGCMRAETRELSATDGSRRNCRARAVMIFLFIV